MNINQIIYEEFSDETKRKLKKIGLGLGAAALAGGAAYGGSKLNQHILNKENEKVDNARKGWNIAHHGINAGLIYHKTTNLFGNKIRSIPATLYLAKNFKNKEARDKESIFQKTINKHVDRLAGADDKLKMLFNHGKVNRKRLLLTHAANTLYAGAKIGGQHLLKTGKLNKHIGNLGLNFLTKALN